MTDIKSMTIDELKELMTQIGEKPFRAKQIYSWLHEHLVTSYDEMANLPKSLKQKLADYPITALETLDVQISKVDGTRKYLFRLADGNMIESVLMRYKYGNSVCISSQAGCRMGCRFCASTIGGLTRNLLPSEMLDQIYRMKQRYGASVEELLTRRDKAAEELEGYQSSGKRIAELTQHKQELYRQTKAAAETLTQARLKAFTSMNRQMREALEFLNMPGVRMVLRHQRGPLASAGQDNIEFLISTNPGEEPKPLAKIASGGELSRIMLAFKSALADKDAISTVIYDEIDTGVSGLAAGRIGQKLKQTASGHQVLCITHTPQIAAFADNQLLIEKKVRDNRTFTEIHPLDLDGRVQVLARMISGDKVTDLSLANARELIEKSQG